MITPAPLQTGDRVGIVAPGGKIISDRLARAVNVLESWGLVVEPGRHVHSASHAYLSGSDDERRSDLQWAIDHPDFKAVFCARGGYGTTRILGDVNFTALHRHPKWVIGFSDITALHLALHDQDIQSIHGAMPSQFFASDAVDSLRALKQVLWGNPVVIDAPVLEINRVGEASGEVVGGNLSLVVDSLGTSIEPDTRGKILVLEDIDEPAYKVDRMLTHLSRADKLSGLAGLVLGYMTGLENSIAHFGEDLPAMVYGKVKTYHFPVAFGFPIGHEHPNMAWCHGRNMRLEVGAERVALSDYPQLAFPQPPPPGV